MQDPERFPALYKAVGKMTWPAPPVSAVALPVAMRVLEADVRDKLVPGEIAWIPADTGSAERRAARLARVRAERELQQERLRIEVRVSQMRQAQMAKAVRESRAAVARMEARLRTGGHTGRLAWMEAQVEKVRALQA